MRTLLHSILLLLILLFLTELSLRLIGFSAYSPPKTNIQADPPQALTPHPRYGLALNPGKYQVTINQGLHYAATHLPDSSRATLRPDTAPPTAGINCYGCSFTYGMGVENEETFPALLQAANPEYRVRNYGCPAWSTLHALLQLRAHCRQGRVPQVAILGYTSLQDARNQLTGIQQKYWRETLYEGQEEKAARARFPYARLRSDSLSVDYLTLEKFSRRRPLSHYLATAYRLENALSNLRYGFPDKYELTERILLEMSKECMERNIRLIVLALDESESAEKLQAFCRRQKIEFVDATLDIFDPNFNLSPYDSHPNATAHRYYARQLIDYLHTFPLFHTEYTPE